MAIKIAINGFGRIGRLTFRRLILNHPEVEVVAINDLGDIQTLAHLLKYDSLYGFFEKPVKVGDGVLEVEGKQIRVFCQKDPENLPWGELKVDIVLECTGVFRHFEGARKHILAGAKKVIISAPGKSEQIPTYLLGVNAQNFDPQRDEIVSMGSCTTNCLAPIARVLDEEFGIEKGFMTTVHSYTNDQRILDLPHHDLRRARAAALNIIPTTTGAAKTVEKCLPALKGKLDGIALRVPTPTVSIVDFVAVLKRETTAQDINHILEKWSQTEELREILKVEYTPLVSSDYRGNSYSAVVDASLTQAFGNLIKVLAWYDNEWGYASRLAEFAQFVGERLK